MLNQVLTQIEKNYGAGAIQQLGKSSNQKIETISTGSLTLDVALGGGGLPKGRVIEIYGPESSGKTTLALHAIAESQREGGVAAFVDAEHALDPKYAKSLGVDIDNLFVCQPDSGEMALDIVDQLVRSNAVDIVVVDSVAALVPRAELEGEMSDSSIGLQARLMSKAMRKITGSLGKSQTTVIFLNQLRSKIGVLYGSPEITSGGNALKFYASVRLDTRRKEVLEGGRGINVKVKVVKNKVGAPFKVCFFDILFGSGIDKVGCLVDAATEIGIITRRGSWYSYNESNFAQGKVNAVEHLKNNPDMMKEVEEGVRRSLTDEGSSIKGVIEAFDEDGEESDEEKVTRTPSILERTIDGVTIEEEVEEGSEQSFFVS